jgi:hypothetical protein
MPNPFHPEQYYSLAKRLAADLNESDREANLRAAVSRAYYAVFLIARDKANVRGKDAVHGQTKAAVQARSFAAGGEYEALRQMRVHADYLLQSGDPGYDAAYDDWQRNWEDAEWYAESLFNFLSAW